MLVVFAYCKHKRTKNNENNRNAKKTTKRKENGNGEENRTTTKKTSGEGKGVRTVGTAKYQNTNISISEREVGENDENDNVACPLKTDASCNSRAGETLKNTIETINK